MAFGKPGPASWRQRKSQKGGIARAAKTTPEQRSAWGKLGGHPRRVRLADVEGKEQGRAA